MKKIKLVKIELQNFKGIRDLTVDFNDTTDISGDNATGKTTIFDAFTWCLFGKDSTDRSQFEIKTLDRLNKPIPKIEHTVKVYLTEDDTPVKLQRTYKEKWVKKRGALEPEFSGHETLYYWNDVPMLAKEYAEKISDIIVEGNFKLITNPLYFNSLPWQERRQVLVNMVGDITDEEIIGENKEFLALITGLKAKTIEEYKREVSSRKKMLRDDLKMIPTRIDEVNLSMPETVDYDEIRKRLKKLEETKEDLQGQSNNKSKAIEGAFKEFSEKKVKVFELNREIQNYKLKVKQGLDKVDDDHSEMISKLTRGRAKANSELVDIDEDLEFCSKKIDEIDVDLDYTRKEWMVVNSSQFVMKEDQITCPTCSQILPDLEGKKSSLEMLFKNNKNEQLSGLGEKGEKLVNDKNIKIKAIIEFEADRKKWEARIVEIDEKISNIPTKTFSSDLEQTLDKDKKWCKMNDDRVDLENALGEAPTVDVSELSSKIKEIDGYIDGEKKLLNGEMEIIRVKNRVTELEAKEKDLAKQISELELKEFTIDNYIREKIEKLETKINSMFKYATFKLFEIQINGGELPCCDTLYQGVPFSDLNNAAKINVGLDIINTLSVAYDVNAPIFIDNAEAVIKLMPTDAQMIRLIVTNDKNLVIT